MRELRMQELRLDDLFRLDVDGPVYEYRGNGWYNTLGGYSGGPWCRPLDRQGGCWVYPLGEQEAAELAGQRSEPDELDQAAAAEGFQLARVSTGTRRPLEISNNDRNTQTRLLSGLDCLPGQMDLFGTDGEG